MKESFDSRLLKWSGFVVAGFLAVAFIIGGGHLDLSTAGGPDRLVQNASGGKAAGAAPVQLRKVGG